MPRSVSTELKGRVPLREKKKDKERVDKERHRQDRHKRERSSYSTDRVTWLVRIELNVRIQLRENDRQRQTEKETGIVSY